MNSCMDRIESVFAEAELNDTGTGKIPATGEVEIAFENVCFAYDKKEVLHDISFALEKNKEGNVGSLDITFQVETQQFKECVWM